MYLGTYVCAKQIASEPVCNTTACCFKINMTNHDHSNMITVGMTLELGTPAGKYWICGEDAYTLIPRDYAGCCHLSTLTTDLAIFPLNSLINKSGGGHHRLKKYMAWFNDLQLFHWRTSLGEKWGIGIVPWYGTVFLAEHIDNITYSMWQFSNLTIQTFKALSNAQQNHQMMLLQHQMALDHIPARQGGNVLLWTLQEEHAVLCCLIHMIT